jgi:hypothetical protein
MQSVGSTLMRRSWASPHNEQNLNDLLVTVSGFASLDVEDGGLRHPALPLEVERDGHAVFLEKSRQILDGAIEE